MFGGPGLTLATGIQWQEVIIGSQMAGDDKALVDIDGDGDLDVLSADVDGDEGSASR